MWVCMCAIMEEGMWGITKTLTLAAGSEELSQRNFFLDGNCNLHTQLDKIFLLGKSGKGYGGI